MPIFAPMLSKNLIKYIRGFQQKKHREAEGLFIAEGPKTVGDLLAVRRARLLVATADWLAANAANAERVEEVTEEELRRASLVQHPQQVLALFPIDGPSATTCALADDELVLALDGIQDPGNLGTIIRIADWFGIQRIYCSTDTADAYNPKVVQATMGSIARVNIYYTDLRQFIANRPEGMPVYGTLLDGENLYAQQKENRGIIVMGNEGRGISPEIVPLLTHRLLIPPSPADRRTAESLNVATATAIVCAEMRRG